MHLRQWLPFLTWPRPTWALMRHDLPAGITVGLMLLPQGVAYAALAGMPLVTGIYAALLPALVAVLFGATPRLGVGPTAITSLLISASLMGLAEPGSAQWVALAAWLAICCGLLQWAMGWMRAGWLLNLVSSPVLNGFTQAAGILIVLSQLPSLLGLRSSWAAWWRQPSWHHFSDWDAALGLGSLLLLWAGKRWLPRWPAAMSVLALAGLVSAGLGLADQGIRVIGHLPSGLPSLSLPATVPLATLLQLLMPVCVISLVSFLEVASSAQTEHRHSGTRWDENRDLIAQGLAKITAGLSGSFAISGSFSRSAVNLANGAQSSWSTMVSLLMVLATVLWLTPWLYHVPLAALAAVVVMAVSNLIQPRKLLAVMRISRVEGCIAWITLALTLATAPHLYWGVLIGVLLSLCHFLYQHLHPRIIEVGLHADGSLRARSIWQLPAIAPDTLSLRMDADWDFASSAALEQTIANYLQQHPHTRQVFLDAQPINRIDITGVESFMRLRQSLQKRACALHIGGLKLPVQATLEQAGALRAGADLHLHRTSEQAVQALRQL